jgi:hypothetical protein
MGAAADRQRSPLAAFYGGHDAVIASSSFCPPTLPQSPQLAPSVVEIKTCASEADVHDHLKPRNTSFLL